MKCKHIPKFFKKLHTLFGAGAVVAVLGLHCCVGFSLVVARVGYSLVMRKGFSSYGTWTLEHRLESCGWGLVALWHVDQRLNACLPH